MSSVFTKIIDGEIPGRFVWSDDRCVGFLSINPLGPGHTLVVPRAEIDQWVDADAGLTAHLTEVARTVGIAVREIWAPPRVGLLVAGFEVPHLHVHVFPAWDMRAFDFANAAAEVDAAEQDGHAEALRTALRGAGHADHVPA
ncbi:HIT family protein [Pseudonocardia sp. Ae168_Ps1]|uniref:HIT family protein n=1 Tax=unclassified Pseudonocardia TaxID=2619320 RepID=UPI0001FFE5EC|nr:MULTISPECIES: HIT family protein [unclassified Pseudonocardia]ALE74017.1 diadenosine tetraphosphate hydrolase [Pseudonocardia sp. EC080625-04]ALL77423.1 diadenosine tetraphosphate hydrolase [Pseudonocardia sp. EC080610-09]ALL80338.1 diadenosine tetraphosphate hydrolase [Pseudonocardia sp. EC080619-01]OLL71137.1 HIT family protein [Pseudonocardia sp. Ae168_Ps1]OLL77313.1 HIT family protein [Pseudonocardia sp. Ae150A_Ps1]